jgi:hypothetical protein
MGADISQTHLPLATGITFTPKSIFEDIEDAERPFHRDFDEKMLSRNPVAVELR